MRGAVHHVAVVEATADTREHHRHRCAPAGRHARVRRTPRAGADRGECAARAHIERRRPPGRAAAPDCRRGGDAARGRKAQALSVDRIGRARGRDARRPAARGEGRRARRCGVPRPANDRARHRRGFAVARAARRAARKRLARVLLDPDRHVGRSNSRHARPLLRQRARPEDRGARSRHAAHAASRHCDSP